MNMKRTLHVWIAVIWLMIMAAPIARAASEPQILQWRLDPDAYKLTLYVRHTGGAAPSGAKIGGTAVADAEIAPNAGETALTTWILFDNSNAMPESVRAKASDLLTTLLGEKGHGETYNFCVFSDHLNVKLRDNDSFADLKREIDAIEYNDRQTYLVGALDKVLTEESARTGPEFVRIVIISAGDESVLDAKAMKGLEERLTSGNAVSGVPVYVIGCDNGSNGDILRRMDALSTLTRARYWNISEAGPSDIANIMRWEEIPVKVSLTVPENLRTGTAQEIEVNFSDGSSASSALVVEGSETVAPNPTPETEADPTESETETENDGFPVAALILILGLSGAAAFWAIQRRNSGAAFRRGSSADADLASMDGAEGFPDDDDDSLNADDDAFTLRLKDMDAPERRFSASLRNRVTIGRSPDNAIALTYDKSISRRHCEIYYQNGELWIQDSGSSGGTYIGNDRVVNATELPNNSTIRLGHVSYRVEMR